MNGFVGFHFHGTSTPTVTDVLTPGFLAGAAALFDRLNRILVWCTFFLNGVCLIRASARGVVSSTKFDGSICVDF